MTEQEISKLAEENKEICLRYGYLMGLLCDLRGAQREASEDIINMDLFHKRKELEEIADNLVFDFMSKAWRKVRGTSDEEKLMEVYPRCESFRRAESGD